MAVPGMTGGESKPILKYNAKSGRCSVDNQVFDKITMIVDLENGESGWIRFPDGSPPDFKMVPMASLVAGGAYPPKPPDVDHSGTPLWKRGFRLMVRISDQLPAPRVREWTSTSLATVRAVDLLHTAWMAGHQPGKVPVVQMTGVKESAGGNYEPVLEIVQWLDRPKDLQPGASEQPQPMRRRSPPPHVTEPTGEPEDFSDYQATFGED
jgi:hypothetical protein